MPVVLIDGRPTTVTEEEARQLTRLSGNTRETTRQAMDRAAATAEEQHYGGAGQQAIAGLEGLASGATIGLSDLLLDDEETRARARYNPGTRLATELTGAIVPALLSGGTGTAASVARLTPTALAASAGAKVARVAGRGLPTALAVEGAIQGAGTAVSRATLANDPLTIESVAAGAGMGGLLGAGLGILSRGTTKAGLSAERRIAQAQEDAAAAAIRKPNPAMTRAANNVDEMVKVAKRSVDEVKVAMKPATVLSHFKKVERAAQSLKSEAASASMYQVTKESGMEATKSLRKADKLFKSAQDALDAGDAEKAYGLMNEYSAALGEVGAAMGSKVQIPTKTVRAITDLAEVATLQKMPGSPAKWVTMPDDVAESFFQKVEKVLATPGDDLASLKESFIGDVEQGLSDVGLALPGRSPADVAAGLRSYRSTLKELNTGIPGAKTGKPPTHSFLEFIKRSAAQSAARGASHAARSSGGGAVLSSLAYQSGAGIFGFLAAEVMGLRAAATAHIDDLVSKMAPKVAKGLKRVAPVTENLRQSIMSVDREPGRKKDQTIREAARDRSREVIQMAGSINDIAYSAVEPVMTQDPETALLLSQQMLKGFQQILAAAPRDPGGTHVGLESGWLPSETQALTFASVLEAVNSPMESLDRMLQGDGDPAAAEALWACYPSLMNEAAVRLVERLPEIQDKTDLGTRAALSTTFRVPLDGLLTQQAIAALQSQFVPSTYRDQVFGENQEAKSSLPKPSNPPGRPPAVNSGSAQMTRTQSLQSSH
jgi:hypothetical protein